MFDVQESLNYIEQKISQWYSMVNLNNATSLFDINIFSENFCRDILNCIFDWDLENANLFKKNMKSIDLKDENKKIAIQVTSENSYEKIKHTVEEFIENGYDKKYEKLIIFILDFKPKNKRKDYLYGDYNFDINNVYYFNNLIDLIKGVKPSNKIFTIRKFFEDEYNYVKSNIETKKLKSELKSEKLLEQDIIERSVIKSSEYNDYLSIFNRKSIDINGLLSESKRILVLGDAASGKTIFLKDVADKINAGDLFFAIYYQLNIYIDKEIENLIPKKYEMIDKKRIIIILDGLDEIEEKYQKDFIKRLREFYQNNPDTTIVISCRTNIYKNKDGAFSGILDGFDEYLLCDFNENEIYEFLKRKGINFREFMNKIENNDYGLMLQSPFYLDIISNLYLQNTNLPKKSEILEKAIDYIYGNDKKKYNCSFNIDKIQAIQKIAIQKIAFVLECLGRNYISDIDLKTIISRSNYQYINYCGLLKNNNGSWSFIHNNFGEYLASLEMGKYTKSELFNIILYKNNKNIKLSWYNTVGFYVMKNSQKEIIDFILKNNPRLVFYIEKDKVTNDKKFLVFKKIISYYMENKIWIPADLLYNNRFIEFFSISEVYGYLCSIIEKNEHYVKSHNALEIMIEMVKYFGTSRIISIVNGVLYSDKFDKYDRKSALYILANYKYGDEKFLSKLIKDLKSKEEPYVRAGYFYYINKMDLVDKMIPDILNYKSIVGSSIKAKWVDDEKDDTVTLMDEHFEFSKLFKNIKELSSIQLIIDDLVQNEKRRERFDKEIVNNLCFSIENLNVRDDIKNEFLFKLYMIFLHHYNRENSNIILEVIDKKKKRVELFKHCLNKNNKHMRYELMNVINNECIETFIEEYKKGTYEDDLAEKIINCIEYGTKYYNSLKDEYENKTQKLIVKPYIPLKEEEKQKLHQECFDSIFTKEQFKKLVMHFFQAINKDSVVLDDLYSLEIEGEHWDDIRFEYIRHCLYRSSNDKTKLLELINIDKFINNWNWDIFVIVESCDFLEHNKNIIVSSHQLEELQRICNNWLKEVDFKTAITYDTPTSTKIDLKCIWLAFLRKKLKLKFPENILLDMLEFELIEDGRNVGLDDIINELGYEKCKIRILSNLNSKELFGEVLGNHIRFCIDHNLFYNKREIYNYFLSSKISAFDKRECIEYLIKSNDKKYIRNIFKNIDKYEEDLTNQILYYLANNKNSNFILRLLERQLKNINSEKIKMSMCSELIKNNRLTGIKQYYKWMECNNKTYSMDLNESISKINCIIYIGIVFKMLQLTFNKDFKDEKFSDLYNNLTKSIVNIAKKDKISNFLIFLYVKMFMRKNKNHIHIGFLNYILIDIKEKKINNESGMNLKDIKKILK